MSDRPRDNDGLEFIAGVITLSTALLTALTVWTVRAIRKATRP